MGDLLLRRRMMMGSVLPAGYTQLEWIGFDGNSWIETNYKMNQDSEIKTLVFATSYGCAIYGTATSPRLTSYIAANVGVQGNQRFGVQTVLIMSDYFVTGNIVTILQNKTSFSVDGVSQNYPMQGQFETIEALSVGRFTNDPATSFFVGKIYSFKISENGLIVLNLIPALRDSDQEIGMWDTVSRTFFTNAGTGAFTGE